MPVIQTHGLHKDYGRIRALKGVSLAVERGEIYGLLGQNGAGKTTLVKILLGIVRKTAGEASLLGAPAGDTATRRRVGYLPEDHQFPGYHSGYSLLDFYGQLYGVPRRDRRRKIPAALEQVGLAGRMHSKIKTYSKGMKQRLGIAQALLHEPEVIFLDEPTDGVDPVGRREIRELMTRLKAEGRTLFVNSHLLGEVELVCDRVAILQQGEVVRQGSIAELTAQKGVFEVGLADGQTFPEAEARAAGFTVRPLASAVRPLWEVGLTAGQSIDPLLRLLYEKGLSLRHLVEKKSTLEDVFVALVGASGLGADRRGNGPAVPIGGSDR